MGLAYQNVVTDGDSHGRSMVWKGVEQRGAEG